MTHDLVIFSFSSNVLESSHKTIALVVESDIDVKSNYLFKQLGFNTAKQYMSSYPGHFRYKSELTQHYLNTTTISEEDKDKTHDLNIRGIMPVLADIWKGFITAKQSIGEEIFVAPTLEEVYQCAKIEGVDRVEPIKLWFCSDWKEE